MISIPPSPAQMSRRPLSTLSGNVGSPYTAPNNIPAKRHVRNQRDDVFDQPRPTKKQFIETDYQNMKRDRLATLHEKQKLATAATTAALKNGLNGLKTPSKVSTDVRREAQAQNVGKAKVKGLRDPPPVFALDKSTSQRGASKLTSTTNSHNDQSITEESVREWQRYYRKAFQSIVFYFDSLPVDVNKRFSEQVLSLGSVCH